MAYSKKKRALTASLFGASVAFFLGASHAQSNDKKPEYLAPILQLILFGSDVGLSDSDRDGDGVIDSDDAFPDNPTETKDTDGDGIGDNSDPNPNVADSLVITSATITDGTAHIAWVSDQPDNCRVLYGIRGLRPEQAFSSTSEFIATGLVQPGTYRVFVECYDYDGSSTFSLPTLMEVL